MKKVLYLAMAMVFGFCTMAIAEDAMNAAPATTDAAVSAPETSAPAAPVEKKASKKKHKKAKKAKKAEAEQPAAPAEQPTPSM